MMVLNNISSYRLQMYCLSVNKTLHVYKVQLDRFIVLTDASGAKMTDHDDNTLNFHELLTLHYMCYTLIASNIAAKDIPPVL